ncbi:hypothetical protein BS47DRAFT_1181577 [Hydnum rufescens UP504]|uniref:Membrane magnesium transporter n=1 Tax=Hydnum rufescens UP504 TaxID=1448309 RepID=A0A9P6ASR3_9AGAM|nr:hypothetical protein BS47DRAFT_1181577 [Hydnum rufescens UP504]
MAERVQFGHSRAADAVTTMPSLLGRSLILIAGLTLFHGAFSTYENLSQLKALGRLGTEHRMPWDTAIELLGALILFIIGATVNAPRLNEITWSSQMAKLSIDEMDSRMSFASVNHRGKRLFGNGSN